jgi:hypothetical protein
VRASGVDDSSCGCCLCPSSSPFTWWGVCRCGLFQ